MSISRSALFTQFFRAQGPTLMMRSTILCSQLALSGLAPPPPPRRRLFVETGSSCGSPLSSGPLNTEALAGSTGLSRTQRKRAQRRTQVHRLRDGPAWQTADVVRKVLMQFHRALQQALGSGFKTRTTRTSLLPTCASNTSSTDLITKHATHLAPAPLCSTDS